ncbi:MAG: DNA-binding domain protein [Acidimicrobiia bacterium]|nr:DNA-binding domain protein [Acidimicrobiia bacterium]
MSFQPQFADALDKTQEAVAKGTEMWTQSVQKMLGDRLLGPIGTFDPSTLIDPIFEGAQNLVGQNPLAGRVLEINRSLAKELMGTVLSFQGIVREHTEALIGAVRDQVGTTVEVAKEQTEKVAQAAQDQQAEAERAARRQERQAAKAAHDAAAAAYAEFTKAELQDELVERGLAKSGNIDELRSRLADDDLAATAG